MKSERFFGRFLNPKNSLKKMFKYSLQNEYIFRGANSPEKCDNKATTEHKTHAEKAALFKRKNGFQKCEISGSF